MKNSGNGSRYKGMFCRYLNLFLTRAFIVFCQWRTCSGGAWYFIYEDSYDSIASPVLPINSIS